MFFVILQNTPLDCNLILRLYFWKIPIYMYLHNILTSSHISVCLCVCNLHLTMNFTMQTKEVHLSQQQLICQKQAKFAYKIQNKYWWMELWDNFKNTCLLIFLLHAFRYIYLRNSHMWKPKNLAIRITSTPNIKIVRYFLTFPIQRGKIIFARDETKFWNNLTQNDSITIQAIREKLRKAHC